jgi:F420-dependent oxidoreductase-like protein
MRIAQVDPAARTAAEATALALDAQERGLDALWIAGGWREPVTLCALVGQQARTIDLGTAIVSVYGIHPTVLAEQALTVNDALQGRFTLGIGVSHRHMVEARLGSDFSKPVRQLREFLTILDGLLTDGSIDFTGELLGSHTELRIQGAPKPDVVVGALSEQSLRVAGALSDGVITTWVPASQIESYALPIVAKAAAAAGRPEPRIIAGTAVCVSTDPGLRDRAAAEFGVYKTRYTAYAAVFERSGVGGVEDLLLAGDEDAVAEQIRQFEAAGASEFCANVFGTPEEQARTRALLSELAKA